MMRTLVIAFLLLVGAALQALLPAPMWLGFASAPVLTALVVFYAIFYGGTMALVVAVLAGLFQDSLSLIPLGYSSFGFAMTVLVMDRYRELMEIQSPLTHAFLTAASHGAVTLLLSALLLKDGLVFWHPLWLMARIPGAVILGLFTGPLIISAAQMLEIKLGLMKGGEDSYGAQRSFYGLG
jgi:cell shape-determining protein MreD